MELMFREIHELIKRDNAPDGVLHPVVSSLSIDAYNSIVWGVPVEWEGFSYTPRFRIGDDAPILYGHGRDLFKSDDPIGLWEGWEVIGDGKSADTKIVAKTRFDLDDSYGKEAYRKHKAGFRKGMSVGFYPLKTLEGDEADRFLQAMGRSERGVTIFFPEWWEVSSVTFPANKDAWGKTEASIRSLIEDVSGSQIKEFKEQIKALNERLDQLSAVLPKEKHLTGADLLHKRRH